MLAMFCVDRCCFCFRTGCALGFWMGWFLVLSGRKAPEQTVCLLGQVHLSGLGALCFFFAWGLGDVLTLLLPSLMMPGCLLACSLALLLYAGFCRLFYLCGLDACSGLPCAFDVNAILTKLHMFTLQDAQAAADRAAVTHHASHFPLLVTRQVSYACDPCHAHARFPCTLAQLVW